MGNLTRSFSKKEFTCKCGCGFDDIDRELVEMLQVVRDLCGFSLIISSGCRCKNHNKKVGGKIHSAHLKGWAVDIKAKKSQTRYFIIKNAIKVGFQRIGLYPTFIHLDIDPDKPQGVIWMGGKD